MGSSTQDLAKPPGEPVSAVRILAAGLLLLFGVGFLAFTMSSSNAANKDFVTYWAAGKQLVHHANPYDAEAIFRLEREAGCKENRPYFMRNPPIALLLALPFGLMNEWLAALLWSLLLVASVMVSIRMIWRMEGRPAERLHLVGYLFPPVLVCLTLGQVGILLLLGFTTFLYFHRSRQFVAGLGLVLCSIKPHIFIPLSVVLLLWCFQRRAYKVLTGFGVGLGCCVMLVSILDPQVWSQYVQMMRSVAILNEPLPTVSLLLRVVVDVNAAWIQFVPAVVASVWAVFFFRRKWEWDWSREGLLLLTVSVMVAPYAFVTDEAVVLPAVLSAVYTLQRNGRSLASFLIVVLPALAEVLFGKGADTFWYVWTAPAWFGFYLYATRAQRKAMHSNRVVV
jgi:Glycosyltransferase family 87